MTSIDIGAFQHGAKAASAKDLFRNILLEGERLELLVRSCRCQQGIKGFLPLACFAGGAGREAHLDPVEQAGTGQRDAERLPGAIVGDGEGAGNFWL